MFTHVSSIISCIKVFADKIASELEQEILDEQKFSRVVLIGKDKSRMKIQDEEI